MDLKIILTGATGMVGEGGLHECLQHIEVSEVLIVNRKPSGIAHPKLKEIVHKDFYNLSAIERNLKGYNTCLFCLGVSSIGMNEKDYSRITYDLTLNFANTLCRQNAGMVFCYISGAATDSSERGRSMWARVKGKTENALLKLPFKAAYMFRPGYIHPTKGLKNTLVMYKIFGFMYPFWRLLFGKYVCTLKELGIAMINAAARGYEKSILEVKDIVKLAKS
jgi:uncharacterized protein YbjT (DUF2867 family)